MVLKFPSGKESFTQSKELRKSIPISTQEAATRLQKPFTKFKGKHP